MVTNNHIIVASGLTQEPADSHQLHPMLDRAKANLAVIEVAGTIGALVADSGHKGVASVLGIRVRGFSAWFLHRTYHVVRIPTLNRKARVIADWTLALFFRRDVVQPGSLQHPREPFAHALGHEERS